MFRVQGSGFGGRDARYGIRDTGSGELPSNTYSSSYSRFIISKFEQKLAKAEAVSIGIVSQAYAFSLLFMLLSSVRRTLSAWPLTTDY